MKDINPYKNGYLRMKRWIKEDIVSFKEKFKESPFLEKIKKNKWDIILTAITIITAIICLTTIISNLDKDSKFNEAIKGPKTEQIVLKDSKDMTIKYKGDIENGLIQGQGTLIITTKSYTMTVEGTFDKIENPKENAVLIGNFSRGYITIEDIVNKITYSWNGVFDNYNLTNGELKVSKENQSILYSGTFINNKLNGIGSKKMYKNGHSKEINGWFENGVLIDKNEK